MDLCIGISFESPDPTKAGKYIAGLQHAATQLGIGIKIINLGAEPGRIQEVDAILFTGGADIDPARYGKANETNLCETIQADRDANELNLASIAAELGIPVLGICRGAQLLNVSRGGTLVTDIPHFGGNQHSPSKDGPDVHHDVKFTPGSLISKIVGSSQGVVNSFHHQAVEAPGEGLTITARDPEDNTAEAIEWSDPTGKPFFLAVQWHPERMDFNDPFAGRLFEAFLWEAELQKKLQKRMGSLSTKVEASEQPG